MDEGLFTVYRIAGMMPSLPPAPASQRRACLGATGEQSHLSCVCVCEWRASQRQDRPQPLHGFLVALLSFASFTGFVSCGMLL